MSQDAFQRDAFQFAGFQMGLVDAGFQCGAFQPDSFQVSEDCAIDVIVTSVPVAEGGHKKQQRMWREQAEALALELIRRRKEAARLALLEDELELSEMAGIYMAWRRNEQPVQVS